jgi:hypothetical protein
MNENLSYTTKIWAIPRDLLKPTGVNSGFSGPPPALRLLLYRSSLQDVVDDDQADPEVAESEFVWELRRSRSRFGVGSHRCLPPLPVESMLPYLSTYAQPRKLCKTWLLAQSTPGSVEPVVLDDSDALFSVTSGILDTTEVDQTEINRCVDGYSRVLVFRF